MKGSEHARTAPARLPALIGLLLLCALPAATAQTPGLVPDGIALAGDLFLAGFSQVLPSGTVPDTVNPSEVNGFDRLLFFPYSKGFDIASDVTEYTTLAIPLVFGLLLSIDQASAVGFVYAEALSLALFSKNAGKFLVPRVRPWVYFAADTGLRPTEPGGDDSFPSGARIDVIRGSSLQRVRVLALLPQFAVARAFRRAQLWPCRHHRGLPRIRGHALHDGHHCGSDPGHRHRECDCPDPNLGDRRPAKSVQPVRLEVPLLSFAF